MDLFEEIDTQALPQVDALQFVPMHRDKRALVRIHAALIWLLITLGALTLAAFKGWLFNGLFWLIAGVAVVVGSVVTIVYESWAVRCEGYAVRAADVHYRSGIWFKSVMSMPIARLQHCAIQQGPIEKLFDLSTLVFFSAASDSGDIRLSGIHIEEAQRIQAFVLRQIGRDEPAT
ncbi:MAG TPA: PH domain-containing protein [Luteibaculaceae bacterium]|nr:PH domain-containing protein [Luteibaculaceae bacterium]